MKRFPAFGKRFFRRARKLVGCCPFAHRWRVAVASLENGQRYRHVAKEIERLFEL